MSNRVFYRVLCLFLLVSTVGACSPAPAPTPTRSIPPTSAATATRSSSPTPAPTATSLPTAVPSPTPPERVQLLADIPLGALPGIGRDPRAVVVLGDRIYVANRSTNNVSVVEDNRVTAVIPVGAAPVALAADDRTGLVYVANEGDSSISFISGSSVVRTVPGPSSPSCLAALDGRLYAGGRDEYAVRVLDGRSGELLTFMPLSSTIGSLTLAVNPAAGLLYAGVYNNVQILSLRDGKATAVLDHANYATLAADSALERVFVSEYDSSTGKEYLVAYDLLGQNELGRAQLGGDPRGMAIDSEAGRIYVVNAWSNNVSVLDGRSLRVIINLPTGLRPLAVAVSKDHQVYVVNADSDNVTVIDGSTLRVLGAVPLGLLPSGMAVHPATGRLYVACASSNSVFVVEGGRVVAEVPVGLYPNDVALSQDASRLFVLNYVSGDLTVISTADHSIVSAISVGKLAQGLALGASPSSGGERPAGQVYAGDTVLDEQTGDLLRHIELLSSNHLAVTPVKIRVDSTAERAYMTASNGIPGSNGGLVIYMVDLHSGEQVQGYVGGLSTTDLALDPAGRRIFSTSGRFSYFQMIVNDTVTLEQTAVVALQKYPSALAFNAETQHVFLGLTQAMMPPWEHAPVIWVLDARGFGTVGSYPLPAGPGATLDPYNMVVDAGRGYVYVADSDLGVIHVLRDAALPPPPSPTPTHTPTPWPTLTPQPAAVARVVPACQRAPGAPFAADWAADDPLRFDLG